MNKKIIIWILAVFLLLVPLVSAEVRDICVQATPAAGQVCGNYGSPSFYVLASNFTLNESVRLINLTTYVHALDAGVSGVRGELRADNGGVPAAAILAFGVNTSVVSASAWETVTLSSSYDTVADTTYWVVWTTPLQGSEPNTKEWTMGKHSTNLACLANSSDDQDVGAYNPNTWGNTYATGDFVLKLGLDDLTSTYTDINITVVDDFNASSINSYSVNISWVNGTTQTLSTTNGSIDLYNVSDNNTNINITFYGVSDYFDLTQTNVAITANSTNTIQGSIYQAVACFDATEYISGAAITPTSFTIGSKTNTQCFNLTAASHSVTANKTGWFSKSQTFNITALSNSTYTINNMSYNNLTVYAKDIVTGAYLSGYSINITSLNNTGWGGEYSASTTNQSFSIINNSYNIKIDHPSYALTDATVNLTVSGNANYTFLLYPSNSLNITFYDELTNAILSAPNISYEIIANDTTATVGWTTNGTAWHEGLGDGTYEIRYRGTWSYSERNYFFTLQSRTYNALSLYLLNKSTTEAITATLYDEYGNKLEGYTIKLLRYYPAESSFLTVDMGNTNAEGTTVLNAIRNEPYYKFRIIDTDGVTVIKTTSSSQIYETTITLYINLGSGVGVELDNLLTVSYALTWLNATNQFKYTWDNSDNTVVSASIYVYETSAVGDILFNSSSSTSSSGTLYSGVARINGTTYIAKAYVTFSGDTNPTLIDTLTQTFEDGVAIFGTFGLFLTFIILVGLSFSGLWNPAAPCILLPVALIITRIAHLHGLAWTWVTAITAVGIIIVYLIRDKS